MLRKKGFWFILAFISLIPLLATVWFFQKQIFPPKLILGQAQSNNPNPTIVFVGDSMTEYLGNFDELRGYLKKYYPDKNFLLLNYGFGSTNILSVQERLLKASDHSGRIFQAINDIPFDLILIESFGHNPLSEYPLEEGLKLQTETLDKIVATIIQKHPRKNIIFVATIAPNKDRYAEGAVILTTEERHKWAEERDSYIKNHIDYAKTHNIPLINTYEKSLGEDGTGNINYINSNDFIHPSPTGVYFISEEIAKFLYQNNFF